MNKTCRNQREILLITKKIVLYFNISFFFIQYGSKINLPVFYLEYVSKIYLYINIFEAITLFSLNIIDIIDALKLG